MFVIKIIILFVLWVISPKKVDVGDLTNGYTARAYSFNWLFCYLNNYITRFHRLTAAIYKCSTSKLFTWLFLKEMDQQSFNI